MRFSFWRARNQLVVGDPKVAGVILQSFRQKFTINITGQSFKKCQKKFKLLIVKSSIPLINGWYVLREGMAICEAGWLGLTFFKIGFLWTRWWFVSPALLVNSRLHIVYGMLHSLNVRGINDDAKISTVWVMLKWFVDGSKWGCCKTCWFCE